MTSRKITFYELGRGFSTHQGKPLYSWPYEVCYVPSRAPSAWYMAEGDARNGNGDFFSPREVLEPQWRSHFEYTQTLWLLPFLERMANGEVVDEEEIFAAYFSRHNKEPTPEERTLYG